MCSNNQSYLSGQFEKNCNWNRNVANYVNTFVEIEKKSNDRRYLRTLKEMEHEQKMEEYLRRDDERKKQLQIELMREENHRDDIKKLERANFHEAKIRQQLRESNQELRELEMKLRTAYVSKGLAMQLAEKEAAVLRERIAQKNFDEQVNQSRIREEEYQSRLREMDYKKQLELRQSLFDQIKSKREAKRKLYQEFLKEKCYIDEIIHRIQVEQFEEMRSKLERKSQFQNDVRRLIAEKEMFKQRDLLEQEEENERIKKYVDERDKKLKEEEEIRKRYQEERFEQIGKMGQELLDEEVKARQREQLILDLQVHENNAIAEQKMRESLEQEIRRRIEFRFSLDLQRLDKERRQHDQKEEDRLFREQQMILFAERDKLEQLSNEKRNRKKIEHRREIEEILEERKAIRASEMRELMESRQAEKMDEENRQRMIEEERIKILKEHATALIGFLPPGILRESDREFFALPPSAKP